MGCPHYLSRWSQALLTSFLDNLNLEIAVLTLVETNCRNVSKYMENTFLFPYIVPGLSLVRQYQLLYCLLLHHACKMF